MLTEFWWRNLFGNIYLEKRGGNNYMKLYLREISREDGTSSDSSNGELWY